MNQDHLKSGNGSSHPHDSRSAEQIAADLDHTRSSMDADLKELETRLSPGYLFDEAVHRLKDGGMSQYFHNLGTTVKNNPVPLALVGVGLAWLAFSERQKSSGGRRLHGRPLAGLDTEYDDYLAAYSDYPHASVTDDIELLIFEEDEEAPRHAGASDRSLRDKMQSGVEHAKSSAHDVIDSVTEKTSEARSKADSAMASAKSKTDELVGKAREKLHSGLQQGDALRQRAERATKLARYRAARARARLRHQALRAKEETSDYIQHKPLVAVGLAVAIGAVMGSLLPSTRREDAWMGDSSDALKRTAGDEAERIKDKGKQAMQATADALREEESPMAPTSPQAASGSSVGDSETSELSERLDETLRHGEDKIARAGDAATRAVKDQIHH